MTRPWNRTVVLALAAIACLFAMVTISVVTGASQEAFEIVRSPEIYAADLAAHAGALRALFGIDSVFLILYATLFVVFGQHIQTAATRTLVTLAIAAMLGTAVLDMVEDHHILAMLYGVESGTRPTAGELAFQHTLSQVKFNVSYLGLFSLGLCVPRVTLAGRALALLLTVGTLIQGAWLYAAPVAMLPAGYFGRWLGFVVGLALVIPLARHRAAGAAATDAPA
jgi:hypothetical protein